MSKNTVHQNASRRLGLIGWIKARRLERKLRKRWNGDPAFRARVRSAVSAGLENHEFTAKAKPKFNEGVCVNE